MMHVAAIYVRRKGGYTVLAVGMNTPEMHAESVAVAKLSKAHLPKKLESRLRLVVWRVNHGGHVLGSKPCALCVKMLDGCRVSFKTISYSETVEREGYKKKDVDKKTSPYMVETTLHALRSDNAPHMGYLMLEKRNSN
jgi:hypothetical protein